MADTARASKAAGQTDADIESEDDVACVRDIEITEDQSLSIAERHELENESGCVVWDCALVLSNFLIKQKDIGGITFSGKRVIELGSGTGAVGLTAAALGAAEVLLTDRPHLIKNLCSNIKRNNLQHIATATAYEWGQQPLPSQLHPPYDILLCSDLVYTPGSVQQLLTSLQELSGPGSVMYASCEFREGAGLELLHHLMPKYQLREQLVPYTDLHEDWCSPDILVWRIVKEQLQHTQGKQLKHQDKEQGADKISTAGST